MDIYVEQESGSYTFEGMSIPNDPANRHYQELQAKLNANPVEATITPWAGSPEELEAAKTEVQNAITQEFSNVSLQQGFITTVSEMTVFSSIIDGLTAPAADLLKLQANAQVAAVAVVVVDAYGTVGQVNAYDPVTDPGWQL